jgi:hypothetical protein
LHLNVAGASCIEFGLLDQLRALDFWPAH